MVLALVSCGTPRAGLPAGATIAVQEFDIPRSAVFERYTGAKGTVGMRYAELLAQHLTRLGYEATAVPTGTPLQGDLRITGSILELDGGSTAKRVLVGFGAGHSEIDVYGTVTGADGKVVGEFSESRGSNKGWSQSGSIEHAMRRTAGFGDGEHADRFIVDAWIGPW
jgi:hypothetical protein